MRTLGEIRTDAHRFLRANSIEKLADLLEVPFFGLEYLLKNIEYKEFYVPKKSGGKRLIEEPEDFLKSVQRKLSNFLQAVYYLVRPTCAYGFQWAVYNEKAPRNILTNAQNHLGKKWMLNADFKDFFHLIKQETIVLMFTTKPFNFSAGMAAELAILCSYKGRLPMGAPTSPVLSNLASLPLDKDLMDYAHQKKLAFTRYADDLTFSSLEELHLEHLAEIRRLCENRGLFFNPKKIHFYGPEATKVVTGLIVSDKIGLSEEYVRELKSEIRKYGHALEVQFRSGRSNPAYFEQFEQELKGHIAFVDFVLGKDDPTYLKIMRVYDEANNASRAFEPVSWLDFAYLNLT